MNIYYVLWTYMANHSRLMRIRADNPEAAYTAATSLFGEDFHKSATVVVFDTPPAYLSHKGEQMSVIDYQFVNTGVG